MRLSYNKLWKTLIDRGLKRVELKTMASISSSSLAKLGKNEPVSLEVIFKICNVLKCNIGDVVEFVD